MHSFQAPPQARQRSMYRHKLSQEARTRTEDPSRSNMMFDRRIIRGNTYAPTLRPSQPTAERTLRRNRKQATARDLTSTRSSGSMGMGMAEASSTADFERLPTPPAVPGRVHMTIQTDDYLEDLRPQPNAKQDQLTQTDPEMDRPTPPLFTPQSSGEDKTTQIDENTLMGPLFDFQMHAEPVLQVLCSKALDQSLMEVLEEEELKEIQQHRLDFQQQRNADLAEVQCMESKEKRRWSEKLRRDEQAEERLGEIEALRKQQQARSQRHRELVDAQIDEKINRPDPVAVRYAGIKTQVHSSFVPWLTDMVQERLEVTEGSRGMVDKLMQDVGVRFLNENESGRRKRRMEALLHAEVGAGAQQARVGNILTHAQAHRAADSSSHQHTGGGVPMLAIIRKEVEEDLADHANYVRIQAIIKGKIERKLHEERMEAKRIREAERRRQLVRERLANESPLEKLKRLPADLGFVVKAGAAVSNSASVEVVSVARDGGAVHASIIPGDVVTHIDQQRIGSVEELGEVLESLIPGDMVELQVVRSLDNRREKISVEVGAAPIALMAEDPTDITYTSLHEVRALRQEIDMPYHTGVLYTPTDARHAIQQMRSRLGFNIKSHGPGTETGVVAHKVAADGPAARANIRVGDRLMAINGSGVEDSKAFLAKLSAFQPGESVRIRLERGSGAGPMEEVLLELGAMGGVSVEWIRSLRFIAGMATSADGSSSSISSSSSRSSSSNVGSGSGSAGVRKSGDGEDGAVVLSAKEKLWKREQALLSVSEITPSLNIQAAAASGSADVGIEIAKLDMFSGGMQASLTPGDIVMELNEQPVNSLSDVHTLLVSLSLQAGDVVDLMVVRALDGREEYVACELGDLHGKLSLSGIRQLRTEGGLHVHTGTLYDQQSAFDVLSKVPATLNVKTRSTSVQGGTVSALEITGMRAGASQQQAALQALSRAGVNVGDYILSIDGVPCADSTALGRLLNSKTAGDSVSVVRQRGRSGDADSVLVELEGDMTVGSVKNSNSNVKNLPQSSSEWVRCLRVMAGLATHDSSDGARAMQARGTNPKTRNVSTELVKQAQQELTLMQPSLGMTLAQSDTPTLGAVKVAAVDASGMALQAFIVPGDHLLSINGEVITDPFAYHRLLDACKVGETLSVDVRRALDARVETLTVEVGSSPSSASSASFLTAKETQSKIRDLRAIAGMGVQSRTVLSPSEALSSLRALTAVHGMSLQAAKSNAKSGYAGLSVIGVDGGEGVSSVSIAGRAGLVEGDVLTSVIINSDVNDSARSHTVEQHDLTAADTSALLRSVIEESRLAGDTVTFSVHRANTDAEFKVDLELAGLNKARAHAANAGQARAQRVVPQEKVRALRLLAGLPICLYVGEKLDDIRHRNTRASQGERRQKEQRGKLLSELRSIMPSLGLEVMDAPDGKEGVVVTSVSATGSAVHASIIVGDTVRALNKTRVPNTTSFKRAVNSMTAGEVVTVTLLRALDGRADSEACEVGGDGVSLSSIRSLRSQLDMSVHAGKTYTKDSAAAELREFQPRLGFKIVDGVGAGVKVIDVMPQGPAARAGLQDGDFILKMAGDASDETSDMKHILARLTVGDRVPLLVKRADGNTFDSAIELGARGERTDTVEFVRSLRRIAGMEVMQ